MPNVARAASLNGVGSQSIIEESAQTYAVAVRDGDVGTAIPEPGTFGFVLLVLAGGAGCRRFSEPLAA